MTDPNCIDWSVMLNFTQLNRHGGYCCCSQLRLSGNTGNSLERTPGKAQDTCKYNPTSQCAIKYQLLSARFLSLSAADNKSLGLQADGCSRFFHSLHTLYSRGPSAGPANPGRGPGRRCGHKTHNTVADSEPARRPRRTRVGQSVMPPLRQNGTTVGRLDRVMEKP
jgi:hypothetical protein